MGSVGTGHWQRLRARLASAVVLSVLWFTVPADGQPIVYRTIAVEGDPVFQTPGSSFVGFNPPTIGPDGTIAFDAMILGPGGHRHAIFDWRPGLGRLIAQEGEPMAQHPTLSYLNFGTPIVDQSGRLIFQADYSTIANTGVIIAGFADDLRIIAFAGSDSNPDADYLQGLGRLSTPLLTRGGRLGFARNSQFVRELWGGTTDGVELLAYPDMPAPGYPPGVFLGNYGSWRLNEQGQMITRASISGFAGTVILLAGPDETSVPVGPDLPTPGIVGTFISAGASASVNGAGDLGIIASYDDEAGTTRQGLWVGRPASLQPIAQGDTQAPGLPDGFEFVGFSGSPHVTHSGHAIFLGFAEDGGGVDRTGFWLWDGQSVNLLVEYGDPVVNLPGATFVELVSDSHFAVNDLNQMAIAARVDVPGSGLEVGLLVTDLEGQLHAVAIGGQPFELAAGDVRIIQGIATHHTFVSGPLTGMNGTDGFGTFLNDRGQMGFRIYFEDESLAIVTATVGCLQVTSQDIVCHGDGETFTVNVEGISACTGDTIMASFTASGGAVGEDLCFTFLVDDQAGFCCSAEVCVPVPDCTPPDEVACEADLDGDTQIGINDLLIVLGAWGGGAGDVTGDGITDLLDFLLVLGSWGPC